jgi:hypothetical protein
MELQSIVPEFLHKDELSYELKIRGINTEGYNVADLPSIFRKSREVKENIAACTNSDIFLAPDKAVGFCLQRFQQIKELVENTDGSAVSTDFPRYLHRLRHVSTRLRHLLQFGKLAPDLRSDTVKLHEEVQQYMQHTMAQIVSSQNTQSSVDQTPTVVSFSIGQSDPTSDRNVTNPQNPTQSMPPDPTLLCVHLFRRIRYLPNN